MPWRPLPRGEHTQTARSDGLRVSLAGLEEVRHPGQRDHKQRREKKAEQGVDPNQRDIEATKRDADPKGAKRAVCFQAKGSGGDSEYARCGRREQYSPEARRVPDLGTSTGCYLCRVTEDDVMEAVCQSVRQAMPREPRLVLAVSGGLDSMVLLDAAARALRYPRPVVATFDHATGSAAAEANALVVERAAVLGLECEVGRAPSALSSEAELREVRWSFLRLVAMRIGGNVVTAHTADDQLETVLMRLMRSTGARGLAGLYADSDIVRPLVGLSRSTLAAYAAAARLRWIEDPSNASPSYFRNRIRHDLLPRLRAARPSLAGELMEASREAAQLRHEVEEFVVAFIAPRTASHGRGLDVSVECLASFAAPSLALLWPAIVARANVILDRRGLMRLVDFTVTGRIGGRIQLSGGWQVVRARATFEARSVSNDETTMIPLSLSNTTSYGGGDWQFRRVVERPSDSPWVAWLPTDHPLAVRRWQPGDVMTGARTSRAA